jgi:hypothetical protein
VRTKTERCLTKSIGSKDVHKPVFVKINHSSSVCTLYIQPQLRGNICKCTQSDQVCTRGF